MSLISQKIKQKPTFRQILFHKVKAVRELQIENQTHLTYVQAQFIVNQKTIKESVIFYILKQKYKQEFENVQSFWKNTIDDDAFIDDLFYLKKKVVEEQWIGQKMKQQKLQQKQQKVKEFISKTKNKFGVKNRLKTLKDELSIAQNRINMAKNQDQSLKLVKEYAELKSEQNFLKNRNRRMLSLQQERNAQKMSKSNISVISQFQEKIEMRINQNIKKKYIREMSPSQTKSDQNQNENQHNHQDLIKSESIIKINRLEKVFDAFAKKEGKESMLFGEMLIAQKFISLQNYLKMISSVNLDSLLTFEQKVNIFKTNTNYEKRINFSQFINAIIQVAKKSSQKLSINLNSTFFSHFIDQFLQRAKQNQRYESVSIHQKNNTNYLRNKEKTKYEFKLYPHTGKLVGNISEELIDRKKTKQEKFKKLKEHNLERKLSIQATLTPIVEQHNKKPIENKLSLKLIDFQRQQKSPLHPKQNRYKKNTYLHIYKRKLEDSHRKQSRYGQTRPQVSSFEASEIVQQNSFSNNSNAFKKEVEDLKDLISIEEDDTFLTNHLQRKANLVDSLKLGKRFPKVHF